MYTANYTSLYDISRAVVDEIIQGLFTIREYAADGDWEKWEKFCRYVALNPLLIICRNPVPVLNAFARQ